jgi:hypothetical protein
VTNRFSYGMVEAHLTAINPIMQPELQGHYRWYKPNRRHLTVVKQMSPKWEGALEPTNRECNPNGLQNNRLHNHNRRTCHNCKTDDVTETEV